MFQSIKFIRTKLREKREEEERKRNSQHEAYMKRQEFAFRKRMGMIMDADGNWRRRFWIDPNCGNDFNPGSFDYPFRTERAAIEVASDGDLLVVVPSQVIKKGE